MGPSEQTAFEQCLHVPTAIGDDEDDDPVAQNTVDHPEVSQQHLAKFSKPEPFKLLGHRSALGKVVERLDHGQELIQQGIGVIRAPRLYQITMDFFEIVFGTLRQLDAV